MVKKIAFCFLLTNYFKYPQIWESFFNGNKDHYNIYSHIKTINSPNIPDFIKKTCVKTVKTKWCGVSLVNAFLNMLKEALKDPENEYFVLLSGECIPLYTFDKTYQKIINEPRTRIEIFNLPNFPNSKKTHLYGSQWVIVNRRDAINLMSIKKHYDSLRDVVDKYGHCPDEMYLIHYLKKLYGNSLYNFVKNKIVTYTEWDKEASHPKVFIHENINKKKMCDSDALFARKFLDYDIAKEIAMKC